MPLSGHHDVALFEERRKRRLINTKIDNYFIIASLKREIIGKLINRIPGSRLLISSLPGSALRTHIQSLSKPCNVNKRSKSLPGKLDIKRHSPSILYIFFKLLANYHS